MRQTCLWSCRIVAVTETLSKEEFAFRLEREYKRKKAAEGGEGRVYGFRTMAKNIVARLNPPKAVDREKAAESWRRQIQHFLKARHAASPEVRRALAEELGCDPQVFGVSQDDDPRPDDELLERVRALRRDVERRFDKFEQMVTQPR